MDNKQATLELGTKPVGRLLWQYALPAIVAMLASSLYNTIDSIFIGQGVGPYAIAGLAITFPLMNLSAAFGAAIGVGSSTCISVKLGQKDYRTAEQIFGTSIVLNVLVGLLFCVVTLLLLDPILRFFGASDQTIPYAREYMVIILAGNIFTHMFFGMNAILRAVGKPRHAMYATIFTVALNTVLTPIFIWPLGMGIQGAAWATVISQTATMVWQMTLFSNKADIIHLKRGIYKMPGRLVKNILAIGVSPFSMNVCACVVVVFINNSLARYGGDMAVGAYGIANKVAFMFVMITMGMNQGMFPIAGYNYGAGLHDRMLRVLKYTAWWATAITTVGFLLAFVFPYECARLFTSDDTLISEGMNAIRINMAAFPIVGFQIVVTGFFQSIGKVRQSIFLSLSRQLLFLLPLLVVLPPLFGLNGVWMSLPIAGVVAAVVTAVMLALYVKRLRTDK